jgi:threonine/homoserine/homoserine lactone efflux protein
MIDALALLTVAAAFFVVAAAPGPANLGCAFVSLRHGRVAGLRFDMIRAAFAR